MSRLVSVESLASMINRIYTFTLSIFGKQMLLAGTCFFLAILSTSNKNDISSEKFLPVLHVYLYTELFAS